jgi:hypothetical protein
MVNFAVHGVGRPERSLDPGEDERWITVEQFERLLEAVAGHEDAHLTFDDGNASDVEVALPRLVSRSSSRWPAASASGGTSIRTGCASWSTPGWTSAPTGGSGGTGGGWTTGRRGVSWRRRPNC